MELLRFPLFRIGVAFLAGLIAAPYAGFSPALPVIIALLVIPMVLWRHRLVCSALLLTSAIMAGFWLHAVATDIPPSHYANYVTQQPQDVFGIVTERIKNGKKSNRYVVAVRKIGGQPCSGKLLLNIKGEMEHVTSGSRIAFTTVVRLHRPPANPGQFDYGAYLANQSIHAQAYAETNSIVIGPPEYTIQYWCDKLRQRISNGLARSGINAEALQVLNALVLGQRQELDRELVENYEIAGAVHILSVSGLHVGFVAMALNLLMRPLPRSRNGRLARLAIQLASLWGFALLTGLSPSVVRSAAMFSMLAAGDSMRRQQNRFHTLMVSAVLILLANPLLIRDVGFQLSYGAVTFIIWLYPAMRAIWEPGNAVLQYFRDILAVSVAAQIGTLPLCLYYFHQFPGLFLLTNLAVIPLVTVIMLSGIVCMAIALFWKVPTVLLKIPETAIFLMNRAIGFIAKIDSFSWTQIPCGMAMCVALMLVAIELGRYAAVPRRARLVMVLAALLIFQTALFWERKVVMDISEMIVFHERHNTLITKRYGNHITAYSDSVDNFAIEPYQIANFNRTVRRAPPADLMFFKRQKLLLARDSLRPTNVRPDIVVLSKSPRLNLDRALALWQPKLVIADGTNYKSYVERWKKSCRKQKIPFHPTGEKGSFVLREKIISR